METAKLNIYLLSSPAFLADEFARFKLDHGIKWDAGEAYGAQVLCEVAGRTCYQSFNSPRPGGQQAYFDNIKSSQHGSVVEHANWSFLIAGVSRSLTHELVRHRLLSYSQLSQRYVDESRTQYVEPAIIANDPEAHAIWRDAVASCHAAYAKLADRLKEIVPADLPPTDRRKAARQAARSVLPNATETKIVVTGNARAFRNFLEQRGSRHAEPEIRALANGVHRILNDQAPALFGDYTRTQLADGTFELTTPYRKI